MRKRFSLGYRSLFALFLLAFGPSLAEAQSVTLPFAESLSLSDTTTVVTRRFDLTDLPNRPIVVVEVQVDPGDPAISVDLGFGNYLPSLGALTCGGGVPSTVTNPAPGVWRLENRLFECDPDFTTYVGITADVTVRLQSLGSSAPPIPLDLGIFGVTQPPFGEEFVDFSGATATETLTFQATRTTTIYEFPPNTSNGAGSSFWTGVDSVPFGPTNVGFDLRSLFAFDAARFIPPTATIDDADVRLSVTEVLAGGGTVDLYTLAEDPFGSGVPWAEGDGNFLVSDTFSGEISASPAATWQDRNSAGIPWNTQGGDLEAYMDSRSITSTGTADFSSTALRNAVAAQVASGDDGEGFLVDMLLPSFPDRGVRFSTPRLIVQYTTTDPYVLLEDFSESIQTGAFSFVSEGQDFRWIYDLDGDDVLLTDIGGRCTALPSAGAGTNLPYSYSYSGDAAFVGHDCCAWRIDSVQSGTVGTGQAIFFHNLDPSNPAHLPPDTDGDGIRDLCDNCLWHANGPLLGSCLSGPDEGALCRSDLECSGGAVCSLAQEDANLDEVGDACPEPGFGFALAAGCLGLSSASRSGRRCRVSSADRLAGSR